MIVAGQTQKSEVQPLFVAAAAAAAFFRSVDVHAEDFLNGYANDEPRSGNRSMDLSNPISQTQQPQWLENAGTFPP